MGLVASDIGRASTPASVNNWRNVNCVARNVKDFGFLSWIACVLGVSCGEETTGALKAIGARTIRSRPLRGPATTTRRAHPSSRRGADVPSALETMLGIVIISSKDETTPGVASADCNVSKLSRGVFATTAAWSAFGAATRAIGFLSDAARAGAEDEPVDTALAASFEETRASWKNMQGVIESRISAGQKLAFSDDQVRDSLSLLLAQTGNLDEALKRQKLAMDLSGGAHIDLQTASKVTDEDVNVLGRYGITVQKGASETELFGAIQQKFAGRAEVHGNSAQGSIERVHHAIDNWKGSVGQALGRGKA